jgi:hypothetical protein
MTKTTRRIHVDPEYACALGYAVYCFGSLEWNVVWIIERLDPGYIQKIRGKSARNISNDLIARTKKSPWLEATLLSRLRALSDRFSILVDRRNELLHANSSSAPGGGQRLHYFGKTGNIDWPLDDVITVTQNFESANLEANELFQRHLPNSAPKQ